MVSQNEPGAANRPLTATSVQRDPQSDCVEINSGIARAPNGLSSRLAVSKHPLMAFAYSFRSCEFYPKRPILARELEISLIKKARVRPIMPGRDRIHHIPRETVIKIKTNQIQQTTNDQ
jgi:hypothetical protein